MKKLCHCGKPAVGVVSIGIGHAYYCKEHAEQMEKEGYYVDYNNWRLQTDTQNNIKEKKPC